MCAQQSSKLTEASTRESPSWPCVQAGSVLAELLNVNKNERYAMLRANAFSFWNVWQARGGKSEGSCQWQFVFLQICSCNPLLLHSSWGSKFRKRRKDCRLMVWYMHSSMQSLEADRNCGPQQHMPFLSSRCAHVLRQGG